VVQREGTGQKSRGEGEKVTVGESGGSKTRSAASHYKGEKKTKPLGSIGVTL